MSREASALSKPVAVFQLLLRRAEVDRALALAVVAQTWSLATGPVTLLLIALYLTPELQGYYYTFGSLLALQSFVELGFYLVITQFASHEWAHLGLDRAGRIMGESVALSRLVSLGRLAFKWYAVASCIFVVGVSTAGYIFFSRNPHPGIDWVSPWFTLVLLTGLQLWMLPLLSLLEGCNQVANINLFRLIRAVLGTMALWLALALGGGLWVAPVWVGVGWLVNLTFLFLRYRPFFQPFLSPPTSACMSWRSEIWPMQCRLALSAVVSYFAFSLFNPVMFTYHSAIVAGQMGMTWQVIIALQGVALAWVYTKVPRFGMLIAKKEYVALDRLFLRTSTVSLVVIGCGAGALWLVVYGLYTLGHPLAQRLLPPLPTGLFLLAAVLMQVGQCLVAYLRAHKREVVVVVGVVSSLAIGLLVWSLGSRYGPTGAAAGYLAVVAVFIIPYETALWFRYRAEWHKA